MSRIGYILLLFIGIRCTGTNEPGPTQGTWTLVLGAQPTYFHGLHFADQLNGWAVGDSGKILHTSDGGDTWHPESSGTNVTLKCVFFINPSKGWIGAGNNSIGTTTDGGASWSWQHPAGEPRRTFMGVSFVDENSGWIVDNFSGILHTDDGGLMWDPQASGVASPWAITSVQFLNAEEGWATATNRLVLHTTDGGYHWSKLTLDSLDYGRKVVVIYEDIFFINPSKGWLATVSGASDTDYHPAPILNTLDGGRTWDVRLTPEGDFVNAVVFANDYMGWGACRGGILSTNDGGVHWSFQLRMPGSLFTDICSVSPSRCWALTFLGSVYRYGVP